MMHVILDGTLIESDRLAGIRESSTDLWSAPTTWAPRDDPSHKTIQVREAREWPP